MSKLDEVNERIRILGSAQKLKDILMPDSRKWYQFCSSLDVIEDTNEAIEYYSNFDWPKLVGGQYLSVYGLLQCIFVQQDAVINLAESLGCKDITKKDFTHERKTRNVAVGHPTKFNDKGEIWYTFVNRNMLAKDNIYLTQESRNGSKWQIIITDKVIEGHLLKIESILIYIEKFILETLKIQPPYGE